jgi:flavin-dependent dehydrogenase
MTGLINRTRTFTHDDGTPLVAGLVAVGDAHTCTNPAYGRGMSLALKQAVMLADELAQHDDVLAAGRAYEAASNDFVLPWYRFSVMTDEMRKAAAAAGADPRSGGGDPFGALFAGGADPETVRLLMRVMNLLEQPNVLLEKLPELQAKAAAAPKPEQPAPDVKRPSRADLLAVTA